MIGKATCGSSASGLSNYLNNEQKKEWREVQNLPGQNRHQDVRLINDTASMSKAEKPVYHLSISYADGDNPSKAQMLADGKATLSTLGLGEHQAVFVAHNDSDHQHLHIMANRVNPATGKAQNMWGDHHKIRTQMRAIEKARGYEQTRLKNPDKDLELTNGEYHKLKEQGLEKMPLKAKAEFYDFKKSFEQANSWQDLHNDLTEVQCTIEAKGRGGVIRDHSTDKTMKLSRVGREHSFGKLQKGFGKLKDYKKSLEISRDVSKSIPDRKIGQATARIIKEGYGDKAISKGAKSQFRNAIQGAWSAQKSVSKITKMANSLSSKNPALAPMKYASKAGKGILKQLEREQNRGRGLTM